MNEKYKLIHVEFGERSVEFETQLKNKACLCST